MEVKCSKLRYNDYLLLTVGLDAEWSRPRTAESTLAAFEKVCDQFGECAADNLYAKSLAADKRERQVLYKPISYLPIGHADSLAFVLVDDFSTVHSITAKVETAIEEISLAFSPRVESFLPARDSKWGSHILDPHKLLAKLLYEPDTRPPTIAFTRIKLTGLATLGLGLPLQEAILRATANVIIETLEILERCHSPDESPESVSRAKGLDALEITQDTLEHTWISVLDLLGPEEIGLLIATPNLSIATTLASRLECLRFKDLFQAEPGLAGMLAATEHFKKLLQAYSQILDSERNPNRKTREFSDISHLGGSHITRWSRTTVGTWPKQFASLSRPGERCDSCLPLRGWVNATTEMRVASGHRKLVDEQLHEWLGSHVGEHPRKTFPGGVEFRLHGLGRADMLVEHCLIPPAGTNASTAGAFRHTPDRALVPFEEFLRNVFGMMCHLTDKSRRKAIRNLVGTSSFTSIPVPILWESTPDGRRDLLFPDFDQEDHIGPMEILLPALRRGLRGEPAGGGLLSPDAVFRETKKYGLPEALVSSLQFIYQDYISICTNPMTYDAVLDLYDSFATLHKVLTKSLPDQIDRSKGPGLQKCQIDYQRAQQISRFLIALHRTMQHRLHQAFPEDVHRDMEADYRGGLHAIQYAADSVLKCGVGIFRRHVLNYLNPSGRAERDRVGVLTRTDFEPGIVNTLLHLGVENGPNGAQLSFVRMDVPHTLHVPSYVDTLHETFHLIYNHLRGSPHREASFLKDTNFLEDSNTPGANKPKPKPFLPTVPHGSPFDEHIDEIFVNLLTVMLVNARKPELYKEHFMLQFASSLRWELPDQAGFRTSIANKLVRIFYTIEGARHLCKSYSEHNSGDTGFLESVDDAQLASRFGACANAALSYLPLVEFFGDRTPEVTKDILEKTTELLLEVHRSMVPLLGIAIRKVEEIVFRVWRHILRPSEPPSAELPDAITKSQLFKEIHDLELSIAKLMIQWRRSGEILKSISDSPLAASEMISAAEPVNPFLIIAQVLRQLMEHRAYFFREQGSAETAKPHIPLEHGVSDNDGNVLEALRNNGNQSEFFISLTSPSLVCTSPQKRAERLRLHIISIKSLWDVSSHLRAERLVEMLGCIKPG